MNNIIDNILNKIKKRDDLQLIIEKEFKEKKIVFTNGCFDILHRGHLLYLIECKKKGDILIVAVNSDNSIKKLKGDKRPINKLEDRLFFLASLSFVDFVTWFDEDNPVETIKLIKPHIHVKGGDYKEEELIEYKILKEIGSEICIVNFINGYSTTNIINKIKGI